MSRGVNALDTINLGLMRAREWKEAQSELPKSPFVEVKSRGRSSPYAIVCHTDGAWSREHRAGGMGWIFQDKNKRQINRGSSSRGHVSSPLVAEGLAIRHALDHALSIGISVIQVASDSQQIVTAITNGNRLSEIYGILEDIAHLSSLFIEVNFISVSRKTNCLADSSAKLALRAFLAPGD
ncbi:unnamed protein product [Microthlaspi erraticum]|uniref:RNase H type-1 domain-containing protein n=1 Tax=Microthlaspi erraticum TaxID=1685480 RepID=A0A6D2KXT7_9BRAS|nr:unnamed protein product [Microthlaspi erraticum]